MPITLYEATVPQFLQVVGGLRCALDKGLEHAKACGLDPDALLEARLIEDMFPLSFQLLRVADHSAGALRDVSQGAFTMPSQPSLDYAGFQKLLAEAEAALKGWTPEAVNGLEDREVLFNAGGLNLTFTGGAYLFSFALPNFFFHAVTAYDLLRMKGVPVGKRDFLGQMRMRL